MDIHGKTILVTGGGRGIGREITRLLVAGGAKTIIVGQNRGHLDDTVAELGPDVTAIQADLSDRGSVDSLIGNVVSRHGALAGLVNNAGIQTRMDFLEGDGSRWIDEARREISVNLEAAVALCAGLLPVLRKQPQAAILNVTTGLAIAPKQSSPVYCATKAGLRTFTRTLRYQCEDSAPHVQVTEGILTIVDTDMTRGYGRAKISPRQAAGELVRGLRDGRSEIWVGSARLLRLLNGLSPALAARIMRRR